MQTIFLFIQLLAVQLISFYTLSVNDIDGNNISFSDFHGKKVLIVNTGLAPADTAQYGKLEQLYQKYKDSLVIIAVPSDDFGNAPVSNDSIKNFIRSRYNVHYIIAEKTAVKGTGISPLYSWLTDISKNGALQDPVKKDFYKYLIDAGGNPAGIFSNNVDPMDSTIQNLITDN